MEDAMSMAKEAVSLMLEEASIFPKPSLAATIRLHRGDFISMIPFEPKDAKAKGDSLR